MVLRKRSYNINQRADLVYSRLTWVVEQVHGTIGEWINYKVNTSKSWIGILENGSRKFSIVKTDRFPQMKFFQIEIRGQIIGQGEICCLEVEFRLAGYILVFFSVILAISAWNFIHHEDSYFIVWFLLFLIIWILLVKNKLHFLENKIEELFSCNKK
jgi:hypothetical protein